MEKWETSTKRAWKDITEWLLNHIFTYFLAFILPGSGTMLAMWYIPSNISIQKAAIYGFLGGLGGLVILFILGYLIQLILAPQKQRNEAREEIEKLKDKLDQIKNARPNIVLIKTEKLLSPIKNIRTGEILGEPWFVRVQFANDPLSSLQAIEANNVVGHIDIYGHDGKRLLGAGQRLRKLHLEVNRLRQNKL